MYREHLPTDNLQGIVECFWTSQSDGSVTDPTGARILPDGCADLIFDLQSESSYWVGTMTRSLVLDGNRGPQDYFGIRFHPGGARGLLGRPLRELTDQRVATDDVTPEITPLLEHVLGAKCEERKSLIESWLMRGARPAKNFALVKAAFQRVQRSMGAERVETIATGLGVSRQYLNRVMNDGAGIDLKTLGRVLRMRACTRQLNGASEIDWSQVATEFGFYDQSHLIHEFQDLVGLAPTEYFR